MARCTACTGGVMPAPGVAAVGAFANASRACLFQSSTAVAGESAEAVGTEPPSAAAVSAATATPVTRRARQPLSWLFALSFIIPPLVVGRRAVTVEAPLQPRGQKHRQVMRVGAVPLGLATSEGAATDAAAGRRHRFESDAM